MSAFHTDQNIICLRAPDEFLSGLLSIAFAACYCRAEGDLDTFPEQAGCWYLAGLRGGSARLTCESGCLYLESGQVLSISGESPLDVLFHGNGTLFVLCLKGSIPQQLLRQGEQPVGALYPNGAAILESAISHLEEEQLRSDGVAAQFGSAAAYRVLMELYGTESTAPKNEKQLPQVVEAALKILQQDFAFLDGIGDLAQRLQVSQEYLTRIFREHVGMTPGKYLVQVRVEQAKLLLQRNDHSVAFVADACGFTNGNYFARVFRNIVGVTPSVYAREYSGQNALPHPMLDSFYVL